MRIKKEQFQSLLLHEHASPKDVSTICKQLSPEIKQNAKKNRKNRVSLPECVVGSVFSINVKPQAWYNVLSNMNSYAGWDELSEKDCKKISLTDLVGLSNRKATFEKVIFRNSQVTSTTNGIRKSIAAILFSKILIKEGIETISDLKADKLLNCYRKIRQIPGQQSGVTFVFMLMLAGWKDMVKPDRKIQKYCTTVMGRNLRPAYCAELVRQAAYALNLEPSNLDLAIFRNEGNNG